MPFEHRDGMCETCGKRIYRYPHPQSGQPDRWAHLVSADWVDDPHDPVPRRDAQCQECGAALIAHPTLEDRWAHADKTAAGGEHAAVPKAGR